MKQLLIIFILTVAQNCLFSQVTTDSVINEVEKNNTKLSAIRNHIEADKLYNKSGIYLNDPEFGLNYLWGSPSAIGNRTDISITQSFDFPSSYIYRKQISKIKNEQSELEYKTDLTEIMLETRLICIELIYYNALISEMSERLTHAESIAGSYQLKFKTGESNILEFNKAQLNLLTAKNEFENKVLERDLLLSKLQSLNGGIYIEFSVKQHQRKQIPEDFEEWFQTVKETIPFLNKIKHEIEISKKEEKLNKSMGLPKLHAGYMSEKITDEQFQGITLGVSIPLWENKNKLKYAKARTLAVKSILEDAQLKLYNELKRLHTKSVKLAEMTDEYRETYYKIDNTDLLNKAFDSGEIGLIDFMLELSIYYDSFDRLLKSERDLNMTLAELLRFI